MWTFGNVFDDKHRRIDILVCWLDGKLTCENTNRAVNFFTFFKTIQPQHRNNKYKCSNLCNYHRYGKNHKIHHIPN